MGTLRLTSIAVLFATGVALVAPPLVSQPIVPGFTVHEWGTFTSIAGEDGRAVWWGVQDGPTDLPCFVARDRANIKRSTFGTVRMETPVLYFYARNNITVQVKVRFRQGVITEWFPPAAVEIHNRYGRDFEGTIAWNDVEVLPGLSAEFPVESGTSHYYRARHTDASPLKSGLNTERFLFYRGVGHFAPPISAAIARDGRLTVWSAQDHVLGEVILFENRGGAINYQVSQAQGETLALDLPPPDAGSSALRHDMLRILTANGLYAREAEAMVETWSDSWFEEGMRLFYIVPPAFVDAILPLEIAPVPSDITRVFVGRLELVTAATRTALAHALATGDRATLEKYGRFLQPIGLRILADAAPEERALIEEHLAAASVQFATLPSSCS
jgi:hypothetical protein